MRGWSARRRRQGLSANRLAGAARLDDVEHRAHPVGRRRHSAGTCQPSVALGCRATERAPKHRRSIHPRYIYIALVTVGRRIPAADHACHTDVARPCDANAKTAPRTTFTDRHVKHSQFASCTRAVFTRGYVRGPLITVHVVPTYDACHRRMRPGYPWMCHSSCFARRRHSSARIKRGERRWTPRAITSGDAAAPSGASPIWPRRPAGECDSVPRRSRGATARRPAQPRCDGSVVPRAFGWRRPGVQGPGPRAVRRGRPSGASPPGGGRSAGPPVRGPGARRVAA